MTLLPPLDSISQFWNHLRKQFLVLHYHCLWHQWLANSSSLFQASHRTFTTFIFHEWVLLSRHLITAIRRYYNLACARILWRRLDFVKLRNISLDFLALLFLCRLFSSLLWFKGKLDRVILCHIDLRIVRIIFTSSLLPGRLSRSWETTELAFVFKAFLSYLLVLLRSWNLYRSVIDNFLADWHCSFGAIFLTKVSCTCYFIVFLITIVILWFFFTPVYVWLNTSIHQGLSLESWFSDDVDWLLRSLLLLTDLLIFKHLWYIAAIAKHRNLWLGFGGVLGIVNNVSWLLFLQVNLEKTLSNRLRLISHSPNRLILVHHLPSISAWCWTSMEQSLLDRLNLLWVIVVALKDMRFFIDFWVEVRLRLRSASHFESFYRSACLITTLSWLPPDVALVIEKLLLNGAFVHRRVESTHRCLMPTSHFLPRWELALAHMLRELIARRDDELYALGCQLSGELSVFRLDFGCSSM